MTSLDIIVLLVMGGAGALGFMRGLVTEALSLAAWVFAVAAVKLFHAPVAASLEKTVGTAAGASTLAAVLVFGLAMFAGRMVARHIGSQTRNSFVGSFDRVLGLGFGTVKGLVLASVAFLFVTLVYDTIFGAATARPQWMAQSRTYPLLNASSRALVDFVRARQGQPAAEDGR